MPRTRSLLSRLDSPVKIMAAIFGLIVAVLGAGWSGKAVLDATYASAANTQRKFDSLELSLSKRDLRDLKKQRGELERAKETRGLSQYEKGRLKEINDDIESLENDLKPQKK
jgi:cytidylate kinase